MYFFTKKVLLQEELKEIPLIQISAKKIPKRDGISHPSHHRYDSESLDNKALCDKYYYRTPNIR